MSNAFRAYCPMSDRGYIAPVKTRNVATPENVAKKALPQNVATFVGGYIFLGTSNPKM